MTPEAIAQCRIEIEDILTHLERSVGHAYDIAGELLSVGELKVCLEFLREHIADDNISLPNDKTSRAGGLTQGSGHAIHRSGKASKLQN